MKLWWLLLAAGCHDAASERRGRFFVPLTALAQADDEEVATVDGRPIYNSQVVAQARAKKSDARQALADLIDAETLAGEARRRGLDRDVEAQEAAESTAVRRLLATRFETEVTATSVPISLLKKVYEKNREQLDHDMEIDVWHILTPTRGLSPEQKQAARAAAEELARRARGVGSLEHFKALSPASKYEHVVTEKDGWTLKEFSHPAFEQLHKPGDTSSVIETSFGFHVLYLVGFRPARHTSFAEAELELRKHVFPEFQKPELIHWIERLSASHEISVHSDRLK